MTRQLVCSIWAALLSMPFAAAQAPESETPPARPRAPLADVADIDPAVDVSRRETQPPPAAPRASQAAEAPGAPAAAPAPRARPVIDSLDLGTTSITGNQELPKVLYIVPWKRSALGDPVARPVNSLLDEVLAPIDPEVFEREVGFYESLFGNSQEE